MEMLKSTFSNRASFCFRQAFARLAHKKQYASPVAHTRRREEFLERQMQNLYRKKPSFNRKYDPLSRNVYRKVEDDEDHNDMDETDDRFWRLTDKEIEEERRRITKEMILKRKEKIRLGQKEPNILTWAARTQIRFLHAEDPYQWTPEVLAESFPVSKETIISILKQKRLPMDETEIEKHDQKVHRNWLKLKSELENRKEASQSLEGANKVDNRISKMINAAGIPSLPLPSQDEIVLTRKKLVEKLHPKVTGTFSAILSDYKAQFKLDDKDKIGIGDKPRKVAFAIGDQEAVQLLTTISTMNINETVSDADHGHDTMERLPESGSQQKSETEQDQSVSESEKSRQVISSLRQSRRQRRLRETTVTKENLDELQMQGTGKIS